MFGLSISKILFTILVVVVVWKGFALVGRLARERQAELARRRREQPAPGRRASGAGGRTVELVECRRCGAYYDPAVGCGCGTRSG